MNERDKETVKLIALICGNTASIGAGVAIFENRPSVAWIAIAFAVMAVITIRSLK